MRTLRGTTIALALAVTLGPGAPPAVAATDAWFEGTAAVGCFGCGPYGPAGNSASFTVTGLYDNTAMLAAPGTAAYTVNGGGGGYGCVIGSTASGTITIAGDPAGTRQFHATVLGAFITITITRNGYQRIDGAAVMTITNPASVPPCGGSITARVIGHLYAA